MPFISIVIPTYNESARIIQTLEKIFNYMEKGKNRFEVIVSDDGSRDNTTGVIEQKFSGKSNLRILRRPVNKGKGLTVKEGVVNSKGDVVLFSDADLSTPIEEIDKLLKFIEQGFDVVIGSRNLKDPDVEVQKTAHRFVMGRIFSVLIGLFVFWGTKDTQCGFKMFTRKAADEVFKRQKLEGFSFDVELIYLAKKLGFKVKEVPVNWHESEGTRVKLFRDSAKMTKDILKIKSMHRNTNWNIK